MTNILTAAEAANALRCDVTDPAMLDLLAQVDGYILTATGHDWSGDNPISPVAKNAARMLLVMWHEDPGMMAQKNAPLSFGLTAALVQLESMETQNMEFMSQGGAGFYALPGAAVGDTVVSVTGLVGIAGDQAALFESVISQNGYIRQISNNNLYLKWFRAKLKPVGAP